MHQDICTHFTRLDCHSVGLKTIVQIFNGVVSLVYDLYTECTVIITHDGGHHRNAEVLDIHTDRICRHGVGKHDIFGIVICHIILLAAGQYSSGKERNCNVSEFMLHTSSIYLLLSFGWIWDPGEESS